MRASPNMSQGFLVDNIVYFFNNKTLWLWSTGSIVNGIEDMVNLRNKHDSNNFFTKEFDNKIQLVTYIESFEKDYIPHLCVVTEQYIEILDFKKYPPHKITFQHQNKAINRLNFDLMNPVKSKF